jgi:probable HAF family extracellular repeat protein
MPYQSTTGGGVRSTPRGRRTSRTFALAVTALLAGGVAPLTAAHAAAAAYTITDLGTIEGGTYSTPGGLNASGQVAGTVDLAATVPTTGCPPKHRPCVEHLEHAFVYQNGVMTDLGTLGGNLSYGTAINTAGEVAGTSQTSAEIDHAFLDRGGVVTDLGTLTGTGDSEATGINDSGQVVGQSYSSSGSEHAFLYTNGVMTDLGTLGSTSSSAAGINNAGVVVGASDLADGDEHAFVYQNGKMTDLGTLGGTSSAAYAINNNGQIAGYSQSASEATHVFLYTGGKLTDLGQYNIDTVPAAINDSDVIVGSTYGELPDGDTFTDAFIHTAAGGFQDLNTLIPAGSGWVLTDAVAVNDSGQILCEADQTGTGNIHAFLLTPTA